MRKRAILAAFAAPLMALPFISSPANAHGFPTNPPSRAALCNQGVVSNCGDIRWEPQSVEGPKGFPVRGPADGRICAGGDSRFTQLDNPRNGNWPATTLTSGAGFTFTWKLTAPHATSSFRYYITKQGWDPTQPLTRSALESTPFLTVSYNGQQPPYSVSHTGTLPSGRSGKALILGVWDIADTANAFYSCSDVRF